MHPTNAAAEVSSAAFDGEARMSRRALVLGAGGAAGIAWETGVIAGLADAGINVREGVIASRLPVHTWPEHRLLVVAVDAESGERRVFDRTSGVQLVDAVAASCALPGVWPPVTIDGRRYMDGGMY
jgi:NTE family protein